MASIGIEAQRGAGRNDPPYPPVPIMPLPFLASPANDNFANRSELTGTNISISASLANASSEPGEPSFQNVSAGQSCWWTWTAPNNGVVNLSAIGAGFEPFVTIFTGAQLADLTLVASNNYLHCFGDCGCENHVQSNLMFHVSAGTSYQIAADTYIHNPLSVPQGLVFVPPGQTISYALPTFIPPGGEMNLHLAFTAAPLNDDFERRAPLSGALLTIHASNAGASKQPGEPNHGGNPGGSSVWYSWKAPVSGSVTISTNKPIIYGAPTTTYLGNGETLYGSFSWMTDPGLFSYCYANQYDTVTNYPFFPVFGVYTGSSLGHLTTIAGGANITFDAAAGRTYHIAFDGNMGTTSNIVFYLTQTPPPPNDNFYNAIGLWGGFYQVTGYNVSATSERGEPVNNLDPAGRSVWWRWRAPRSGRVVINLDGSDYPFPVSVYTGRAIRGLRLVGQNYGGISFPTDAGEIYDISVGAYQGNAGEIRMRITETPFW